MSEYDHGSPPALAWRCTDCGHFRLKQFDGELAPAHCALCGGRDIEELRPLPGRGEPAAITAAGRTVLGERRRFPRD